MPTYIQKSQFGRAFSAESYEADRAGLEGAARGARASGTPWISFYAPQEIVTLAREAGFADVRYLPTSEVADRYLAGRPDGLRAASGEATLLARI